MKIVLTGALGFLGSHLWDALLREGHEVRAVDNLVGGSLENLPSQMLTTPLSIENTVNDCCNLEGMTRTCEGADVIYHLAASPHEGLSVFSPVLVNQNTYMSSVVMATAAIRAGVKRFIFCSSMARYGENKLPFREHMPPMPVDPYGIAKVAAERTIRMLGQEHGMEVVTLIPHNIAGPRQKYDDPYRNVISIMANRMLQGKPPIVYGDGKQQRAFSHVDDIIPCLMRAMTCEILRGDLFNVGPDENPVTILGMCDILAEICDYSGPFRFVDQRPCEVKEAWCSADKAREHLGYETKRTLRDILQSVVDWIKLKGPKPFVYHLPLEIVTPRTPKTWTESIF